MGGLSPYSHYDFRVAAVNTIGQGPSSDVVEARTAEQAPSSPPRQVRDWLSHSLLKIHNSGIQFLSNLIHKKVILMLCFTLDLLVLFSLYFSQTLNIWHLSLWHFVCWHYTALHLRKSHWSPPCLLCRSEVVCSAPQQPSSTGMNLRSRTDRWWVTESTTHQTARCRSTRLVCLPLTNFVSAFPFSQMTDAISACIKSLCSYNV